MPYQITNLIMTRHDPMRRGNKPHLARRPITIGQRVIKPGQSILISDPVYDRIQENLKKYQALGLIKMIKLPGMVGHSPATEGTLLEGAEPTVPADSIVLSVDPQDYSSLKIATGDILVEDKASQEAAFAEPSVEEKAAVSETVEAPETTEEVKPTKRKRVVV